LSFYSPVLLMLASFLGPRFRRRIWTNLRAAGGTSWPRRVGAVGHSAKPISLSSAKPICVEVYRCTSPITIVGDRTARWAKQLPAARRCLSSSKLVERSPRHLCSAGYTIFTGLLHDTFLRPTGLS